MFKSLTAFKIADTETKLALLHEDLAAVLEEHGAPEPHATQWSRYGFVKPASFGEDYAFDGSMGARMLCIRRSERILPGTVIKQELSKKVKRIEEKENRRCHRKEIAGLKDDVTAALLPKAFVKSTDYFVMVTGDYLLVDCSSVKLVDEIVAFIADTLHDAGFVTATKLRPLQSRNVAKWLKSVALEEQVLDDEGRSTSHFQHLDSAVLKGNGVVRMKDLEFDTEVGVAALGSSMHFMELAVAWGAEPGGTDLHCSINDNLLVKRLKFSDVLLKQAKDESESEDEVSHFDTTVAIIAPMLRNFVETLIAAVGVDDSEEDEELGTADALALLKSDLATDFMITDRRPTADLNDDEESPGDADPFFIDAVRFVREEGSASITMLQRRFRIGFNRSVKLIEAMEGYSIVSLPDDNGVRSVLTQKPAITKADVDDFDRELEEEDDL
jgi:recombination associated protein RdgC